MAGASATWEQLQESMVRMGGPVPCVRRKEGDVVVTIVDSGLESLTAWLGLASLGAIEAATNSEFRGRMLAYAINNCQPELLVVAAQYLPFVDAVATELTTVKRVLVVDDDGQHYGPIRTTRRHGRSAPTRYRGGP